VVLYCGLIFLLSSISNVPALPGGMSDKVAHALLYAGLGFLLARALAGGFRRQVAWRVVLVVAAFSAAYGLSDEFHQLFVPHRTFDLRDLAADVLGGATGAVLLRLWGILRESRHAY
jgi:VanZ family protein